VTLEAGSELTITTEPVIGDSRRASTTYASLPDDVRAGNTVLLDDGRVRLEVLAARAARCGTASSKAVESRITRASTCRGSR
jgi:pyruvate kinase